MESKFTPSLYEEKLYNFWLQKGYFKSDVNSLKKSFSIILPPPNANADLHLGHAMCVNEDIMIRYHKIKGEDVLWMPGADHAGFETQFVYEKHLKKQGKSRFDYSREEFFKMVWDFVISNKGKMEEQLKKLGFSLDWEKQKFTLDLNIQKIVYETFKKLYDDGLIYRGNKLVNYCTRCGTGFSDLEVNYVEQKTPLYYLKYGPFVLATTRPETKFGDTGIAVNPKDKRYKEWIGKEIEVEGLLGKFKIKVVADSQIDMDFGTGVVKVTPAHDFVDFEIGQKNNLPLKQIIDYRGKLTKETGKFAGLKVKEAREIIVKELQEKGLIEKIDYEYVNRVGTCYKCGNIIEPLPLEQWFVKVEPLAKKAISAIDKKEITFYPTRSKKTALMWLKNFTDWNISRQIVWGMRIPAFFCLDCKKWIVTNGEVPKKCECGSTKITQDTDTFDTWFSSGQWPFATLQSQGEEYFKKYYPTSVMETGYDILPWWVCRMIMLGIYKTGKVPFKKVFLHGMVRDKHGAKMSKSKGNVLNPIDMVTKYGADALRASLIFQLKEGSDVSFSEEKIIGMRNFTNKIWNIGRFISMNEKTPKIQNAKTSESKNDVILEELEKEFAKITKNCDKYMQKMQFSYVLNEMHEFLWHRLADYYIEELKEGLINGNIIILETLKKVYLESLIILHPFMPFVTEAIWQVFNGDESSILKISSTK